MRSLQSFALQLQFGDVIHRTDPACVFAFSIDQRGDIDADIEALAVFAHQLHLEAIGIKSAGQDSLMHDPVPRLLFRGPIRVGWSALLQFFLAPAQHFAEGTVGVNGFSVEIHGADAGDQRVIDGLAHGRFLSQTGFG